MGKNKAITTLMKMLSECELDDNFPVLSLYTYGQENSEVFEARLDEAGYTKEGRYQIGASIGAHIGPGVFGVVFVEKKK